jgi:WhiB family redox-sensing transcriptional regulator
MSLTLVLGRSVAVNAAGRSIEACSQVDPDTMFPDETLPNDADEVQIAKAVCGGCGLRDLCGEAAIARREAWGVWGGMTVKEREALRRRRNRAVQRNREAAEARRIAAIAAAAAEETRAAEWAEQMQLFEVSA